MSPVVRIPALGRRLGLLLLLSTSSCLFRGDGPKLALTEGGDQDWTLLTPNQELPRLGRGIGILALASHSRVLPEAWSEPRFRQALTTWVRGGGQILLLGYAAAYAQPLGLAGKPRVGAHVYGRRGNRDAQGYAYGLDLEADLATDLQLPERLRLGGGTQGRVGYCLYDEGAAREAQVLGTWFREVQGKHEGSRLAALLRWRMGLGTVWACGLTPLSSVRERELLSRISSRLGAEREGAWVALPILPPDPLEDRWIAPHKAPPLPSLAEAPAGLRPRLAHFGLSLPLGTLASDTGKAWMHQALSQGADLILAGVGNQSLRNLQRSPEIQSLPGLARTLHERGALLALELRDPADGSAWARGSQLRSDLRPLVELRPDPRESLDGFGGRGVTAVDLQGPIRELWSQNPGAFLLGSDPEPRDSAASVGEIQPGAGRIRDLPVRGLVDPELSRAFPRRLYSLLHLDPDPAHGGYADWLHAQVRDFLRERDQDASAVVLDLQGRIDPRRLTALLASLQVPLSRARSYRLAATGKGGQRESLNTLLQRPGPALRAQSDAPCGRMVLENRFLRLEGTEGSLIVDRDRAGDFRIGRARSQRVSDRFMTTRLRGARPGPDYIVKVRKILRPLLDDERAGAGRTLRLPLSGDLLPRLVSPTAPAIVEKPLHLPKGSYELRCSVRSQGRGSLVEVRLDDRILGFLACPGGANRSQLLQFGIAVERDARLVLQHRYGEPMQLLGMICEKTADAGLETRSRPAAGPRALVVEEMGSSFLTERRRLLTLGDLPALCMEVDYDEVSTGLRVDRFFAFRGYEVVRKERLGRGTKVFMRLEDPSGIQPALILLAAGLGRNHELVFEGRRGLLMRSYPRSKGGFRLGLVLADELGVARFDAQELWTALEEVLRPPKLTWTQGQRSFSWPWTFPWRRCAILPRAVERPIQLRQGGFWQGVLTGSSGDQGESLLVAGGPGDRNSVSLGEWVGPRPLPGTGRLISYDSDTGTSELSRLSALCPRPGWILDAALGSPSLDGVEWDYHYDDRLWLPRLPGRHRLDLTGDLAFRPSLVATTALVQGCRYDPNARVLSLSIADPRIATRGAQRLFALEIRGPRPTSIEGAILADPDHKGTPGRFRLMAAPGDIRIHFGTPVRPGR